MSQQTAAQSKKARQRAGRALPAGVLPGRGQASAQQTGRAPVLAGAGSGAQACGRQAAAATEYL
eukprot:SAG22_NODE_1862_length_3419_cov_2.217771_2_plen_64_part_00